MKISIYLASRFVFVPIWCAIALHAQGVTIAWTTVGDPGNAPDTQTIASDGTTGYGSVAYSYQIAKYDVTCSQYVEFLNAKDPSGTNTLGLYASGMSTDGNSAGIAFVPTASVGSKYSVITGEGNLPVTYLNWYSALRFANWLSNGQGTGDTENGSYTLLGDTPIPTNASSIARNAGATVVLPNEDEWYKAAYYKGGSVHAGYWTYAMQCNVPISAQPSPTAVNSANFLGFPQGTGVYAATGQSTYSSTQIYLTDVGAYGKSASAYGTFDQSGDVFQWIETADGAGRVLRGGAWGGDYSTVGSATRYNSGYPGEGDNDIGFRVALVPEPGLPTAILLVVFFSFARRRNSGCRPTRGTD